MTEKTIMRNILFRTTIIAIALVALMANKSTYFEKRSDTYIRNRVLQLYGNNMYCSGISIKAPSGKVYILSAAHCREIAVDGKMSVRSENDVVNIVHIVDIDIEHDLMLLSSANNLSVDVADKVSIHESIHTLTHGNHFPTYRTNGEMLEEREIMIPKGLIFTPEDEQKCLSVPYQRIVGGWEGLNVCVQRLVMFMSTAKVVPGSSGGSALNAAGELIGIVSCTDGTFSGLVPLRFIQDFLKTR